MSSIRWTSDTGSWKKHLMSPMTTLTKLWKVSLWKNDPDPQLVKMIHHHQSLPVPFPIRNRYTVACQTPIISYLKVHIKRQKIEKLAEKYKVTFNFKKSARGRPRKDLNEEEKRRLNEFLARADLTYTNPGRKDNVYIGKENRERICKQRLYLLWNLRDIIDIANGTKKIETANSFIQTFNKSLTFL